MNKDQLVFLLSGILFGFLVGYTIAYAIREPNVKAVPAPVPAAGNMGMGSVVGSPAPGPAAPATAGGPGGPGSEAMMQQVFAEVGTLKAAVEKNPKDADSLNRLANIYHDVGKYPEAVDYYKKVIGIRPADVDARTDLGICLREMGKSEEAIKQFRTSLSYDSKHWQTWLNLGVVSLFDKKDLSTAAEAFGKVEELNPTFKDLPLLKEAVRKARQPG
jgi:thioredoxin-like negative regulator of GroEL